VAERVMPAITRAVRFVNKVGVVELLIVGVAYVCYSLVRGAVVERTVEATSRAIRIVEFEQRLGLWAWESKMQAWALSSDFLVFFFNAVYIYAYLPLIVGVGVWLFVCHRQRYVLLRNAFLISGGIGLIIFNLLPTAPPRLLPWPLSDQVVDTMSAFSRIHYDMHPAAFMNHYAAIPSLHFGWDLLLGIGIIWTMRNFLGIAFGVTMPAAMFVAVVVTGNHFIVDVLAGAAVALIGLGLALLLQRYGQRLWQLILPDRIFKHLARSI
jgi:membrane-associated phospholipid phosphatase